MNMDVNVNVNIYMHIDINSMFMAVKDVKISIMINVVHKNDIEPSNDLLKSNSQFSIKQLKSLSLLL